MKNSEVVIDQNKYKYNEDYRKIIQNRFKGELTQPYQQNGNKNPEFIKRYGEDFYKKKVIKSHEEIEEEQLRDGTRKKRVIISPHGGKSQFA